MLDSRQRAILKAYGKAQLTLKSQAVVQYSFLDGELDYLAIPCDELWNLYRSYGEYAVIEWMHPHIHPYWDEYDIGEDDYSEYMHRRFSILFKSEEV